VLQWQFVCPVGTAEEPVMCTTDQGMCVRVCARALALVRARTRVFTRARACVRMRAYACVCVHVYYECAHICALCMMNWYADYTIGMQITLLSKGYIK